MSGINWGTQPRTTDTSFQDTMEINGLRAIVEHQRLRIKELEEKGRELVDELYGNFYFEEKRWIELAQLFGDPNPLEENHECKRTV